MKNLIAFVVLCFFVSNSLVAQSTYKKKVVSYVNKVVVSPSYNLSSRHVDYIASQLSSAIKMERFNYASLPDNIIEKFGNEVSRASNYSAESVRPIIERTLAPELLSILDINKEMLSKQRLTEAEKNTFLATKAQAAGLSASQLEAILNSGFFYAPFVESYKRNVNRGEREVKNKEGKVVGKQKFTTYSHEMKIGLLWYKLNVDKSNTAEISYLGLAKGWGNDAIERSESQDDGADGNADWTAFATAVNVSAVNINNETKKFDAFKLTGGVAEVTTFGVNLTLGNREGVGLDDSFWVEEEMEDASGNVVKEKRGFVKIRSVGNNNKDEAAFSYAQVITGLGYSPGLSVTEIPMLGANGVIGFGQMPILVSEFNKNKRLPTFGLSKYDFAINVNSEIKNTFGLLGSIQANLAKSSNISELWAQFGAGLGFLDVDGKFFLPKYNSSGTQTGIDSTNDIGLSFTGYVGLGLVKKFYVRRFGFIVEGDLKYLLTSFSTTGKDKNNEDLTYSMMHGSFGFGAKAGMEIYIMPTFSIGGGIEYTGAGSGDSWSISVEDKDKNETKLDEAKGPSIKYSGIGFFAWINYALPSLN